MINVSLFSIDRKESKKHQKYISHLTPYGYMMYNIYVKMQTNAETRLRRKRF